MKGLTLILDNDSRELLDGHTRLTNQKAQVNQDIQKITGLVDTNKFSHLSLPVDYTGQLNEIATQVNSNNSEQQVLAQQINEASQQIAALQQKSKTFSIVLIVVIIVIVVIATL